MSETEVEHVLDLNAPFNIVEKNEVSGLDRR